MKWKKRDITVTKISIGDRTVDGWDLRTEKGVFIFTDSENNAINAPMMLV